MKGLITGIKRFAVHDGDGIRTTVFTKGCPLACVWCHNPENISFKKEIGYFSHKCRACGACSLVCEANVFEKGKHKYDKTSCLSCGKCAKICPAEAFTLYGDEVEAKELMPKLLEDRDFYESSGGGITLSGGECLAQADFASELLRLCKESGLNTAVDTCGFVTRNTLDRVIPYTDVFLYDIKAVDPEVHKRCTGHTNEKIIDNIKYLDALGCSIEVRIPYVPGYNSGEMEKIRDLVSELKNVKKVRVLAYHDLAGSKYSAIGRENSLPNTVPSPEEVEAVQRMFDSIKDNTFK